MKNLVINLILGFLIHQNGICQRIFNLDSLQKVEYNKSDIVFLGEVINFDTLSELTSKLKVLELFKGDTVKIAIIKYKGENSLLPISVGLWIIYAKKIDEKFYYIDRFGISRSNKEPDRISYYVPEFPKGKKEYKMLERQMINNKINATVDWFNELYNLRLH
jgi:hypothetical protein